MEKTQEEIKFGFPIMGYQVAIKEGDQIVSISGAGVPSLRIGMKVQLMDGFSIPLTRKFRPDDIVTITGFVEPKGSLDEGRFITATDGKLKGSLSPAHIARIIEDPSNSSPSASIDESTAQDSYAQDISFTSNGDLNDPDAYSSDRMRQLKQAGIKHAMSARPAGSNSKKEKEKERTETVKPGASPGTFTTLRTGSSGESVKEIQSALKAKGFFDAAVDGVFGPETRRAVSKFQEAHSLKSNGTVDDETYKDIIAEEIKSANPAKYWLLKLQGINLSNLATLKPGSRFKFTLYSEADDKENEYKIFKQLNVGDFVLGYEFSFLKAVYCTLKVTVRPHVDVLGRYEANFVVMSILPDLIPLRVLKDKINFSDVDFASENRKLFKLDKQLYEILLSKPDIVEVKTYQGQAGVVEISNDSADADVRDQLEFESDIAALSAVVSYKKVKPPMAIGLFGPWGSGKSFFMNKMKKEIDLNREVPGETYCKEVVQVSFNSWHYSDSNLWASLITKIFEELKDYSANNKKPLDALFENLKSVQEAKEETELKLERVRKEKTDLEGTLGTTKAAIDKEVKNLESASALDIASAVWKDEKVQEHVAAIEKELPGELVENMTGIRTRINELNSFADQFIESVRIAYRFKGAKMFFALLVAVIAALVYYTVKAGNINEAFQWLNIKSVVILSALSQLTVILGPVRKGVSAAYKNLKSLEATCAKLENEQRLAKNKKLEEIKAVIEAKKEEEKKQEAELSELKKKETELSNAIEDIISGKRLHSFIEGKATDERYTSSLGIISWIRKDFEELDFLIRQQHDAEEMLKIKREKVEKVTFRLDRIILYIDDLDRCKEEVVVQVLEAIHLLLAFPLFVVVVGVDPRWVNNALRVKYKDFLDKKAENGISTASSFDYLEKIFQVPFALKPITDEGKDNIIREQLQGIVKLETSKATGIGQTGSTGKENGTETGIPAVTGNGAPATIATNRTGNAGTTPVTQPTGNVTPTPAPTPAAPTTITPPARLVNDRLLNISKEEMDYMQAISFMLGESPRTVNRYINIYRIIRIHTQLEFIDSNELEHYKAVMIMLSFITGSPNQTSYIFGRIAESTEETFGDFLSKEQSLPLQTIGSLKKLYDHIEKEDSLKDLQVIQMSKFKRNLGLISRFSFRGNH